jgi:hypothetical protein
MIQSLRVHFLLLMATAASRLLKLHFEWAATEIYEVVAARLLPNEFALLFSTPTLSSLLEGQSCCLSLNVQNFVLK